MKVVNANSNNKYEVGLSKNPANYTALTPLVFLNRAAHVYPDRLAWIHGERTATYSEFYTRCRKLASALDGIGVKTGNTVAIMSPNTPAMLEAHYGIPMTGAVINALNFRLDAETIAFTLDHGEASVLLTDCSFSTVIKKALEICKVKPIVIDINDAPSEGGEFLGQVEYEDFIASGSPDFNWKWPEDEWDAIALNYTSGTTGNPKGVVFHHRGAYLNSIGNSMAWQMTDKPVYLWTLPMFHCNGWCFTWAIALHAGTHVCLRKVEAKYIYEALEKNKISHFCGAPIVLNMINNALPDEKRPFNQIVNVMTAAAPPPPAVLEAMEATGFRVTHVYGLTEVYGPVTVCAWHEEWDMLPPAERARKKARQGVAYNTLEGLTVADSKSLYETPNDGETIGEVLMRGNTVMKGYLKNPEATEEAFAGGWFHTGDLGVMEQDGYIALKDRAKDIIISGGENISTIEVEGILYKHPAVLEAAVVAKEDPKWGETPCAFVTLKEGVKATPEELMSFCRESMAHYKTPKHIILGSLPKTSTGKVQKFVLREKTKEIL
tara:strand:- start:8730 stop:10376 length:1647 start_codon:yes stop_codon:yes gene_type:complete